MGARSLHRLTVVTGPVSSDKSTWAVIRAKTRSLMAKVLVVRPKTSVRKSQGEKPGLLVTKSGFRIECMEIEYARDLHNLPESEVYVIEEPAIFPDDLEDPVVFDAVEELRKSAEVIVVGLGATSEMTPFGRSMGLLMQVADEVIFMRGLCNWCGKDQTGTRSVFMNPNEAKVADIKVGGTESYRPACVECYNEIVECSPSQKLQRLNPRLGFDIGD